MEMVFIIKIAQKVKFDKNVLPIIISDQVLFYYDESLGERTHKATAPKQPNYLLKPSF